MAVRVTHRDRPGYRATRISDAEGHTAVITTAEAEEPGGRVHGRVTTDRLSLAAEGVTPAAYWALKTHVEHYRTGQPATDALDAPLTPAGSRLIGSGQMEWEHMPYGKLTARAGWDATGRCEMEFVFHRSDGAALFAVGDILLSGWRPPPTDGFEAALRQ